MLHRYFVFAFRKGACYKLSMANEPFRRRSLMERYPKRALVPVALLLRRFAPKVPPNLPLKNAAGSILYTERDWRRELLRRYPVQWLALQAARAVHEAAVRARVVLYRFRAYECRTEADFLLDEAFACLDRYVLDHWKVLLAPEPEDPVDAEVWSTRQELVSLHDWWVGTRKSDRAACLRAMAEEPDAGKRSLLWFRVQEYEQHQLVRLVNVRTVMT